MTTSQSTIAPAPPMRKAAGRGGERRDADVDVGREPAVEADLGPAGRLAPLQGGEIEVGKAHRLLQLVDPVAGKKHPGHVRLAAGHLAGRPAVGGGTAQKGDLLAQARAADRADRDLVLQGILLRADRRRLTANFRSAVDPRQVHRTGFGVQSELAQAELGAVELFPARSRSKHPSEHRCWSSCRDAGPASRSTLRRTPRRSSWHRRCRDRARRGGGPLCG